MGLSKGSVVIVDLHDFNNIYSRFLMDSTGVKLIRSVPTRNCLLIHTESNNLYFVGFDNKSMQIIQSLEVGRPLIDINVHLNSVFLAFQSGDSELFLIDKITQR